eukprot:m.267958 g.267958  ORF g.267958 m.267958 type:complete len:318 (-) comp16253_c1_seq3:254-1207(-)
MNVQKWDKEESLTYIPKYSSEGGSSRQKQQRVEWNQRHHVVEQQFSAAKYRELASLRLDKGFRPKIQTRRAPTSSQSRKSKSKCIPLATGHVSPEKNIVQQMKLENKVVTHEVNNELKKNSEWDDGFTPVNSSERDSGFTPNMGMAATIFEREEQFIDFILDSMLDELRTELNAMPPKHTVPKVRKKRKIRPTFRGKSHAENSTKELITKYQVLEKEGELQETQPTSKNSQKKTKDKKKMLPISESSMESIYRQKEAFRRHKVFCAPCDYDFMFPWILVESVTDGLIDDIILEVAHEVGLEIDSLVESVLSLELRTQ